MAGRLSERAARGALCALLVAAGSVGLRAADLDFDTDEDGEELDLDLREPNLLLYIPFEGAPDAFARQWTDRSLARVGNRPLTYGFAEGVVGQARGKGPHGYWGCRYPIPGSINLDEGALSLWFRWDKDTANGPVGSFISKDIFPLASDHEVLKPIREDETWHHIVLTWQRKSQRGRVYLDGKDVLSVPLKKEWHRPPRLDENGEPLPVPHDMWIGLNLPGRIDEVYIWDMELPVEAIRSALARGRAGKTSWPKDVLPERKPWRPLAGLRALGEKRRRTDRNWSLAKAKRIETAARVRISLDGRWRCQPLGLTKYVPTSMMEAKEFFGEREKVAQWWPLPGKWTTMTVPGTWQATTEIGAPPAWHGSPLAEYYGALCERDLDAPSEWEGKGLFLRIAGEAFAYGRVMCPISVFVNAHFAGESFATDGSAVDITELVKPGQRNRIALLLGYPALPMEQTTLGSVTLEIHAARDVVVEYAYVTPQDDPARLDLVVEMRKGVEGNLPVQLECQVWDWPESQDRRSLGKRTLSLRAGSDPWYPVSFAFPRPHRWNPEDPHMYNLVVRVSRADGTLIDEGEPVRFGFRTLSTAGREMLLNGKPFHLRGMSHNSPGPGEGGFVYKRSIGQNADRCLSSYLGRGRDAALEACDREGWLQCYHIDFNPYWRESELLGERERFWGLMKHVWNHPSVIAWQRWGNGFVNGPHGHPRQIGGLRGRDYDPEHEWHQRSRVYCKSFHKNAPGRLFFFYRLGVGGDFRGIMHYMGWGTPLQAREEWPSYWHEHCQEPFSLTEGGLPMFSNDYLWQWGRGRGKTPFSGSTAIVEHGARYLGDAAYEDVGRDLAITLDFTDHGREIKGVAVMPLGDVNPDFLDKMPIGAEDAGRGLDVDDLDDAIMADEGKSQTGIPLATHADTTSAYSKEDATNAPKGRWDFDFTPVDSHYTPLYYKLKGFAVRRTLCAWRTYGIGYLIHCCFKRQMLWEPGRMQLNPIGKTVARYNSALLVYVGGRPGDFVAKDHAYYAGEDVAKQIIIRNDHFSPVRIVTNWRAVDLADDTAVAKGQSEFAVDVGALHKAPLTFSAPAADEKRRLRVIVSVTADGERVPEESFDIQIFPRKPPLVPATRKVGLIDPSGDTTAMLKRAGQPYVPIDGKSTLDGLDLLIIGRNGYTEGTRKLLATLKVREAAARGLNVIVFEQTGRWVMGLLNEHFDNRNAFIRDSDSAILAGLTDEDFAEWRGATDLVEAYPDWDRKSNWMGGKYSKHGARNEFGQGRFYHWSNKGMVCTYSYNKPQVGNFRILLDNAFDLLYTPLLEERIGDGRIVFCQLDVTNRYGTDPVASLVVDRLLSEYSAKRTARRSVVAYLGGSEGRKVIDPLGLECREVTDLAGDLGDAQVLIVSADEAATKLANAKEAVGKFLRTGGKVVLLPVTTKTQLDWLPVSVKCEQGEAFATRNLRECSLLRGLGPSDFFWRRCVRCVRVSSEVEGAYNAESGTICCVPWGKGLVIFCQIDPAWFEWCWQQSKATRIWSTVLRNLGAASTLAIDPLRADDTAPSQAYHVKPLPFDPDGHRVW